MKIYVASSWRNERQQLIVEELRNAGHEVYDFKHPAPGDEGFAWEEIDIGWQDWDAKEFVKALEHPAAERGFNNDWRAMVKAEVCVLVNPCGRSAHLEAGYFVGAGKPLIICQTIEPELGYKMSAIEPELMYKMATYIVTNLEQLFLKLQDLESGHHPPIKGRF